MFCAPMSSSTLLTDFQLDQTILRSLPWALIATPRSLSAYQMKTILRSAHSYGMLSAHANVGENISDFAVKHPPTTKTFCDSLLKKVSKQYRSIRTPLFL